MRKCAKAYYADVNAWLAVNATGGGGFTATKESQLGVDDGDGDGTKVNVVDVGLEEGERRFVG